MGRTCLIERAFFERFKEGVSSDLHLMVNLTKKLRIVFMKIYIKSLVMVLSLSLSFMLPCHVLADGGGGSTIQRVYPDIDKAKKAIQKKDWDRAIEILNFAVASDDRNAEAYNLLGYSERMRGNLDAAFIHYERALTLDPKHRGAHEYIGEAYLKVGNLPKAEEHLAKLDKICFFPCEEYSDLETAIADYKDKLSK